MSTWPLAPSLTITRFAIVCPAVKLRFEAFGNRDPVGHTVRKLDAVGLVTVTFSTTAATPWAGTSPRPATGRLIVLPDPTVVDPPMPLRVSSSRAGVSGA